ncbi:zinc-binding protein A33-like [Engraulis encrasicolus]|uniref:zinc-binding protein A33-like n=1 Tax=Engraulis encrasicolus TaxID=184585 RepID=UPI002FD727DA
MYLCLTCAKLAAQQAPQSSAGRQYHVLSKPNRAVWINVLCALLAIIIRVLWFNCILLASQKSQLETNYSILASQKSQFETIYNILNCLPSHQLNTTGAEKDMLLTRLWITQHAVDVTLDPDTAQNYLTLSADGKQVKKGDTSHRPDNPKRFYSGLRVLGKQGFSSGRFYYEVQVSGKTSWGVGVARESVNRKEENLSPANGCWRIWLVNSVYKAIDDPPVTLSLKEKPERVGVFVDYGAGSVSFYDADRWSLIYSYTGVSIREKMYPFFSPGYNDDGKNSAPLVITPVVCAK